MGEPSERFDDFDAIAFAEEQSPDDTEAEPFIPGGCVIVPALKESQPPEVVSKITATALRRRLPNPRRLARELEGMGFDMLHVFELKGLAVSSCVSCEKVRACKVGSVLTHLTSDEV